MKLSVLGLFQYEDDFLTAAGKFKEAGFDDITLMSPIPVHGVEEVLGKKKNRIRYFSYFGAVIGAICGFALAVSTALTFVLPTSGRPIITFPPYLVITYELTILFGVVGNVLGFLLFARLPRGRLPVYYDPRCSGEYFGVAAVCSGNDEEALTSFLTSRGANIGAMD